MVLWRQLSFPWAAGFSAWLLFAPLPEPTHSIEIKRMGTDSDGSAPYVTGTSTKGCPLFLLQHNPDRGKRFSLLCEP